MADPNDERAERARREARRALWLSRVWWAQVPVVAGVYWSVSTEPTIERAMLVYLALVSIIANAVSYASKAKALEAKQAGYENP